MTKTKKQNQHPDASAHSKQRLLLFAALIACAVLLCAAAAGWYIVTQTQRQQAGTSLEDALTVRTPQQTQVAINSQLGFSLTYNQDFIDAHGQVTTSAENKIVKGEEYYNTELTQARSYNIVKLVVKAEVVGNDGIGTLSRPELAILTSARREYFEQRRADNPGVSDLEITVRAFTPGQSVLISRAQETLGGTTYEKLLYETRSGSGTVIAQELQYVTVQNNRPFVASLTYYPTTKQGDLISLNQALESLIYSAPDANAQYLTKGMDEPHTIAASSPTMVLAAADTINAPSSLQEGTDLKVVAKNQLAVVRVGTIYCYDFTLAAASGVAAQEITNACTAGIGSGSIVNKNGNIATNGHVVRLGAREAALTSVQIGALSKDYSSLQKYIDYAVGTGVLPAADGQKIVTGIQQSDQQYLQALQSVLSKIPLERFAIKQERGFYAIQLSDKPLQLKMNAGQLEFAHSDTVLKASFVGADYDPTKKDTLSSMASDVALLAVDEKKDFPAVRIGNIHTLSRGSPLTVVGFPGFVDGGLTTTAKRTIPTATQGDVTATTTDPGGHKLVATDVPLAQGNSGGPAFNKDGEQVGLATYAVLSAADPELGATKFSKQSVIRDVADLTALAAKNNVKLSSESAVNTTWYAAIDAFSAGSYNEALAQFKKVGAPYNNHYLVANLTGIAQDKIGPITIDNPWVVWLTVGTAFVGTAMIIVIILIIRHRAKSRALNQQVPPIVPPQTPTPPQWPPAQF